MSEPKKNDLLRALERIAAALEDANRIALKEHPLQNINPFTGRPICAPASRAIGVLSGAHNDSSLVQEALSSILNGIGTALEDANRIALRNTAGVNNDPEDAALYFGHYANKTAIRGA